MNAEHVLNKDWHPTKFVYHYTRFEIALGKILGAPPTLQLGPFARVNDPWESKNWHFGIESAPDDPTGELTDEVVSSFNRAAKEHTKVLCMTRDREPEEARLNGAAPRSPKASEFHRGYARPRMWAQYGDCHKGVCLAFYRDKLSAIIEERARNCQVFFGEVAYSDHLGLSEATMIKWGDVERYGQEESLRRHFHDLHRLLFFLKSRDWQDETEFRWVVVTDDDKPWFVPFGDALAAVIVGAKFDDTSHLPDLECACAGLSPLFRMEWTNGMPCLAERKPKRSNGA